MSEVICSFVPRRVRHMPDTQLGEMVLDVLHGDSKLTDDEITAVSDEVTHRGMIDILEATALAHDYEGF